MKGSDVLGEHLEGTWRALGEHLELYKAEVRVPKSRLKSNLAQNDQVSSTCGCALGTQQVHQTQAM